MGNKLIALIELARANLTQTQIGFFKAQFIRKLVAVIFLVCGKKNLAR